MQTELCSPHAFTVVFIFASSSLSHSHSKLSLPLSAGQFHPNPIRLGVGKPY